MPTEKKSVKLHFTTSLLDITKRITKIYAVM